MRESLIVEQYINGLTNPEMKRHVQFAHPNTLDRAISLAENLKRLRVLTM